MRFWADVLRKYWGIAADLSRLDGEYDLNFLARTSGEDSYVLKVMRAECPMGLVDVQVKALSHVAQTDADVPMPRVVAALDGASCVVVKDEGGHDRLLWLQTRLPGRCYASVSPKSKELIRHVGSILARASDALASFAHPELERSFKWNLLEANWISAEIGSITDQNRRDLISEIIKEFKGALPKLKAQPHQAIHNDVNDYNLLVTGEMGGVLTVSGLIDLGDICSAPRICDLAIAAAYVVLDHDRPARALAHLVSGFHAVAPLSGEEIDMLWPLLRMRLAVSVVNSTIMAQETPDDPYVTVSQAAAWRFLESFACDPNLIRARLRTACGMPAVENATVITEWLAKQRGQFKPIIDADLETAPMGALSVDACAEPQNPFHMTAAEAAHLGGDPTDGSGLWMGYYREPRLVYTDTTFRKGPWKASDRRTVHLGVDIFAPAGTPVAAPLEGDVLLVENRDLALDYGGFVVLRHRTPDGHAFFTLYGHLDPSCTQKLNAGARVAAGECFAELGTQAENGGWAPHLHFQLLLSADGMVPAWPGVADPDDLEMWEALCPNPAALLNLEDSKLAYVPPHKPDVLAKRQKHFSGNLSLTYAEPVMLLRGWRHHMFDEWGRAYLDAYNNVPHVGHAHPRIQAVAAEQLKRINSNTRYLHPAQIAFAETILSKLPEPFECCFFVNSGSEANELALRLARAHTGKRGMVTTDHSYFGNTTGAIDISAYKFAKPGGAGQPDWVALITAADDHRGPFRRDDPDRAAKYAHLVTPAIRELTDKGHGLAGFITETFPSVGGQIIPPSRYLAKVYEYIRAAGGVCIADEVQTGLGRLGTHYFGFEHQDVVPDVVVLGKPIGNGHPIGVVVTTREIAESFDNGIEFFSTFGGSTLSCCIGKEVLDIVDDEELQANAARQGARLIAGLKDLQTRHFAISDVRGMGLFLGVDLAEPDGRESPSICSYVKNRMREHRILIGSEGPKDNILKIRPPLTIEKDDVDMILETLDKILTEVSCWYASNL